MKKILYLVTQSDFGGAQKYVYDLASNFSQKYEILVAGGEPVSTKVTAGKQRELEIKLQKKGIKYVYISHLKRVVSPWHDFFAFWQIVKLIKKEKPDIIHLNSSKISILGSLASIFVIRNSSLKIVYTVHGWVFNEEIAGWKKIFYKKLEKFTAKFKTNFICLSEFDRQNTLKNKIASQEKISVIYNGIKPINFLSKGEARKRINIAEDKISVGSIGNLYKNKGYEYLIKSTSQLEITNYKLQIIGDGPEEENLKSEIKDLELEDKVKLAGSISGASQYLKAFDIYICSSIKEGMPYTILEAMQAGLPIVSTDVGAIPEIISNNKEGLLIKPKNSERLAEKIKYLIDNPDIAKKLGENAREKVKQFSLERMIKKTEELYNI